MTETTTVPIKEVKGSQEMSTRQGVEDIDLDAECANPEITSQQLKRSRVPWKPVPNKKTKASKTSIDPVMLTEGDLFYIGETVHDVFKVTLQEVMVEQNTMLGVLRTQLHGL